MTLILPIIDRPLDNTALAAYMECPTKYDLSMRQHRRRKGAPSAAINYGSAWHAILEVYYKGGDEWAAKNAGAAIWEDTGKPDDHRTLNRLFLEFDNYRRRWGATPELEDAQTLGADVGQPMVELTLNAAWEGALHPYAGKIDRIIEQNGQLYVEDHKTTSAMGAYYFGQFELDNQMMGYAWLARQLTGRWIAGVRINAHAVLKRESKFARETISFSAARLEDWAENYNLWVRRIERAYLENSFERNFKACSGKYGMCSYSTVCSVDPKIRQRVLEQEFDVLPWNPLEVKDDNPGE